MRLRDCVRFGLCMAQACASAAGYAEVEVHDHATPYLIEGASETALRNEMNAKGPVSKDGRRYHAVTRWDIGWRFRLDRSAGRCAIGNLRVEVKITMMMPAWQNENSAPDALKKLWRDYQADLQAHENGHRQNGVDAAREIELGINELPPRESCDAAEAAANALGLKIVAKYRLKDMEFDRVTDHGRANRMGF